MSKELVKIRNLVKAPRQFHIKGGVISCGPLEVSEEFTKDKLTPMIRDFEKRGLIIIEAGGGV
jgi:hypothetical protein